MTAEAFTVKEKETAAFAKALSHPARVAILNVLARRRSCICGEIVEVLPLSQSTVSQHLKELKKHGLIRGTIEGVTSCYCIDWQNLAKAMNAFHQFSEHLTNYKTKDQCC